MPSHKPVDKHERGELPQKAVELAEEVEQLAKANERSLIAIHQCFASLVRPFRSNGEGPHTVFFPTAKAMDSRQSVTY